MLNPLRGEVALVVDGRRRVMRLTLGALAALEARLEAASLMDLAERFESGRVSASDLTILLTVGLNGGGHAVTEAELSEAEIEGGATAALRAGLEMLAHAFQPLGVDA